MTQHSLKPGVELLEDRSLPVTFGIPWADAQHLTLSWVPDSTFIAGQTSSDLFAALNDQKPTAEWQRDILRAVRTWAAVANINVGLTEDNGQPFGTLTAGLLPSFGDIRVGAQGMTDAELAVSVAHDPFLGGSWSGDLFFNSAADLYTGQTDVYSIALHELGHILGLQPSANPDSVMFNQAVQLRTQLHATDIAAIRALYGARAHDLNDADKRNDTFKEATRLEYEDTADEPGEPVFDGSTPVIGYGDITNVTDVDMFYVRTYEHYTGPMTVRVQTRGISLLAPKLSVYDEDGNLLGQAQASDLGGSEVRFTVPSVDHRAKEYYFRVEAATTDEFAIGRYAIAVTLDDLLTTPEANIQAVMRGAYEELDKEDIMLLLQDPANTLLNEDDYTNEGVLTAVKLQGPPGVSDPRAFQTVGSVQGPTDVDFYRIRAPGGLGPNPRLNLVLRKSEVNGLLPKVKVFNQYLQPLATTVLANGAGAYSLQVAGVRSGQSYYIKVLGDKAGSTANGNYRLEAQFLTSPVKLSIFSQGVLNTTSKASAERSLYVAQTQLFHLLLQAKNLNTTAGAGIRVTLTDASGNTVYDLTATKGQSVSGPQLLLTPGEYTVRYSIVPPPGSTAPARVRFLLIGANLSDPIGPSADDPTLKPIYTGPSPGLYTYPGNVTTTKTYLWSGGII